MFEIISIIEIEQQNRMGREREKQKDRVNDSSRQTNQFFNLSLNHFTFNKFVRYHTLYTHCSMCIITACNH